MGEYAAQLGRALDADLSAVQRQQDLFGSGHHMTGETASQLGDVSTGLEYLMRGAAGEAAQAALSGLSGDVAAIAHDLATLASAAEQARSAIADAKEDYHSLPRGTVTPAERRALTQAGLLDAPGVATGLTPELLAAQRERAREQAASRALSALDGRLGLIDLRLQAGRSTSSSTTRLRIPVRRPATARPRPGAVATPRSAPGRRRRGRSAAPPSSPLAARPPWHPGGSPRSAAGSARAAAEVPRLARGSALVARSARAGRVAQAAASPAGTSPARATVPLPTAAWVASSPADPMRARAARTSAVAPAVPVAWDQAPAGSARSGSVGWQREVLPSAQRVSAGSGPRAPAARVRRRSGPVAPGVASGCSVARVAAGSAAPPAGSAGRGPGPARRSPARPRGSRPARNPVRRTGRRPVRARPAPGRAPRWAAGVAVPVVRRSRGGAGPPGCSLRRSTSRTAPASPTLDRQRVRAGATPRGPRLLPRPSATTTSGDLRPGVDR